ncbi:DUF559 domain-containing protein [Demequina soli]|uniref:DUF559 domain-containing protein n=1 Tax=Demequina soli TaxID=1638987 RepID=UPI000785F8A7|nr:DUF559 domain-containing protein [Demequina soli]
MTRRDALLLPSSVHAGDRSFSRAELVAMTSARQVRTAIARGEVAALFHGRFAAAAHAQAFLPRAHAASECGAVITGRAALFALGAEDVPPARVDATIADGRRVPACAWLSAVRAPCLPEYADWYGCRVAAPAHAVVDLWRRARAGTPGADDSAGVILAALQRRVVAVAQVREALAGAPRVRDRAGLIAVLAAFDEGAESFLELEGLTRTFTGRDFGAFVRQHAVWARGSSYRLDMYDPATLLAVELDGDGNHAAGEDRERDDERDADLATLGIQVLRLPYVDVMTRPEWCRDTVLAVMRIRERQLHA